MNTTLSDIRVKKDVSNITLDDITSFSSLEPKKFKYINDPKERLQFGLIAQDVEKIFPNIIENGSNGIKSIRYQDLIPLLILKVKDMEQEILKLKNLA